MRLLQIRARRDEDVECLMRELAVYSPKRFGRSIMLSLEERPQTDVLALLAALETCLAAHDIPRVHIELDGRSYLMEAPQFLDR